MSAPLSLPDPVDALRAGMRLERAAAVLWSADYETECIALLSLAEGLIAGDHELGPELVVAVLQGEKS